MKVAVLTASISCRSGSRAPIEIAKALQKQESSVTVFGYQENKNKQVLKELQKEKIKIFLVKKNLWGILQLFSQLKREKFEIISFHGTFSFFLAAKLSGALIARTYYGVQLDALTDKLFPKKMGILLKFTNQIINFLIIFKEKIILLNSNLILAISRYSQKEVTRLFHLPSIVVYLGAAPKSFKKKKKINQEEIKILSVSRIVPYKGFHRLIKVFNKIKRRIPNLRLMIVGSSPNFVYLKYLKKISAKGVRFQVNISDKKLIKAYQKADIYATFDQYLFFGLPLLEAANFGLPTVALACCAAPEMVKHGQTGFLANEEKEFRKYLEKLIKDRNLRQKMGKMAYQWSKNFSWQKTASKYINIFKELKIRGLLAPGFSRRRIKPMKRRDIYQLIFIFVLAAGIRILFLESHEFWFDEAFSYFLARLPLLNLFRATAADNNPPAYYLFLKGWLLVSQKIWFLRLFSLIFGVLNLYLVYKVSQKLATLKIAKYVALIFALSPLHVYFSTETRMYSFLVFETLLLYLFFLKLEETQKKLYLLLITLVSLISLYTHYYSGLIILSLNLAFFLKLNKFKKILWLWLVSQIVIILLISPWFWFSNQYPSPGCWCISPVIGLPAMFVSFMIGGMGVVTLREIVFKGPLISLGLFIILSVLSFLLFLKGFWESKKNNNLLVFFFTPLVIISLIGLFSPLFSPRALIVFSPFYYLFLTRGLLTIKKALFRKILTPTILVLLFSSLAFYYFDPFFAGPPLKQSSQFIKEKYQPNEAIFHSSPMTFYSFQFFHQFSYPEFQVIPSDLSAGTIFEIGGYQKPIEKIISDYQKIWWVNISYWVSPGESEKVKNILDKNYLLNFKKSFGNLDIYHYSRGNQEI